MSGFDFQVPRHSTDELTELIRQELPGVEFRLESRGDTHLTEFRMERRVEGLKVAITDEKSRHSPEALSHLTLEAIDRLREKAMVDYGLRAILEREKKQSHIDGFNAMVKNLEQYMDTHMREDYQALDEDGHEVWRKGGLDYNAQRITTWLRSLKAPSPSDLFRPETQ